MCGSCDAMNELRAFESKQSIIQKNGYTSTPNVSSLGKPNLSAAALCLVMPSQLCKAKLVSDEICCSDGTAAGVTLVLDRLSDWRTVGR